MFEFGTDSLFDFGITMQSMAENDWKDKVNAMLDALDELGDGGPIPKDVVDDYMDMYGIPYPLLPQWLKDKIDDEIDVII